MKQRGSVARAGEVIPYIFCLGSDGSSAKSAQADRAYHPDEFRRKDSGLKIDFEFYLSQQVLPPVERLCDEIEGTDRSRLAECLGKSFVPLETLHHDLLGLMAQPGYA
jgi:DNA polymerase alpha subunit A